MGGGPWPENPTTGSRARRRRHPGVFKALFARLATNRSTLLADRTLLDDITRQSCTMNIVKPLAKQHAKAIM